MTTWYVKSGTGGTDDGSSSANAAESVSGLLAAQVVAGGDIILVDKNHAYSAGAAITWALPESGTGTVAVLCVDFAASYALATGAVEETGGNSAFSVNQAGSNCNVYIYGMTLKSGAGSGAGVVIVVGNSAGGAFTVDNCLLWVNSSSSVYSGFGTTTGAAGARALAINTQFRFASAGSYVRIGSGVFDFINCSVHASSTSPTSFFKPAGSVRALVRVAACDLSAATYALDQSIASTVEWKFSNCQIQTPVTGTHAGYGQSIAEFIACAPVDGTNGADVLNYYYEDACGVVEDDQGVYLTSGASQGTQDDGTATSYSFKMTPNSRCNLYAPLCSPWMTKKIAATGSKTLTVKVADTEGSPLKNVELELQIEYMGGVAAADCPQTEFVGTAPLVSGTLSRDVQASGSNLTDTNEAWTGITETDTYDLAKTVTVDEQGFAYGRVALYKQTTNPIYVDGTLRVT